VSANASHEGYPLGTPDTPSIGGVPWSGSLHLTPPADVQDDPIALLRWRTLFDFYWTLCNLIQITDKATNKFIPFVPNRPQAWGLWLMLNQTAQGDPVRQWWLKGRQFGFSTLWVTILYICALFRKQNSFLLVHSEIVGKSLMRKPQSAHNALPEVVHQEYEIDPETGEKTPKGAPIMVRLAQDMSSSRAETLMSWVTGSAMGVLRRDSAENLDAGVGETYQNAQFSEVPLFRNASHTIGHLMPAMTPTPYSHIGAEFTARGEGDYAHKIFLDGMGEDGLFEAGFFAWYWHTPYARPRRPSDKPFTPEEISYRAHVQEHGLIYPLKDDYSGLVPELQEVWDQHKKIRIDDLRKGFLLTDEQMLYIRDRLKEFAGDRSKLQSEFPPTPEDAFQVGGRKLVPSDVIMRMGEHKKSYLLPRKPSDPHPGLGEYTAALGKDGKSIVRWTGRLDGRWRRWEVPRPGAVYVIWADPSSGAGDDPTAAGIYRIEYQKCVTVATFQGWERPHEMSRILARAGRHYRSHMVVSKGANGLHQLKGGRPAMVALERNGYGEHVIDQLVYRLKYMRVFRFDDPMKDTRPIGHDYGFPTKKNTKNAMLLSFSQGCFDGEIIFPCERALKDIGAVQYLKDEAGVTILGAPRGQHDDFAMGGGVGYYFARNLPEFKHKPVEDTPAWLKGRQESLPPERWSTG
jgi:hypothetical protein